MCKSCSVGHFCWSVGAQTLWVCEGQKVTLTEQCIQTHLLFAGQRAVCGQLVADGAGSSSGLLMAHSNQQQPSGEKNKNTRDRKNCLYTFEVVFYKSESYHGGNREPKSWADLCVSLYSTSFCKISHWAFLSSLVLKKWNMLLRFTIHGWAFATALTIRSWNNSSFLSLQKTTALMKIYKHHGVRSYVIVTWRRP